MTIQEKVDRFRKIGIEKILEDQNICAEFAQFYKSFFGVKICVGCNNKMRQKFNELINLTSENLKIMSKKLFVMMPGKLIDTSMASSGPTGQYNSSTMTDEIALQLLKKHPGYLKYFDEYPENWQKLLTGKPKSVKKPDAPVGASADVATEKTPQPEVNETEALLKDTKSTDMNAKDVIAFVERLDNAGFIESWTSGEADLEKKRKTVLKAVKKRLRQLAE